MSETVTVCPQCSEPIRGDDGVEVCEQCGWMPHSGSD